MYRLTGLAVNDDSIALITAGRLVWWSVNGILREIWIMVD